MTEAIRTWACPTHGSLWNVGDRCYTCEQSFERIPLPEKDKDQLAQVNKDWVADNRDYVRCSNLRRAGFTLALKNGCLEIQGGKCAICGVDLKTLPRREVHADHCHGSGLARGVLCHHCNTGLGAFRDDPERLARAIEYLKNPTLEPLV